MSRSQCPWAHPLPVAPHSVLQAVQPRLPAVSDPVYQWWFAAPLRSTAEALGCSRAGPWCFCWASASGGRGGLGLAPGACELAAGEGTPGTVSASEHHGGWWEAARGATHRARLPLHLSSGFPAELSRPGQCSLAAKQVGRHCDIVLAPSSAGVLVCLLAGQV